jgi:6-phosphofructokinase 2
MPVPALNEKELEKIIERIKEIEKLDFIVISGSISADISSKIFSQLDLISRKKKAKLIVDTSGEALKCAVDHGVYLIKPNISELAYIAGKEYLRADEIVYQAKNIIRTKNCEIIVVSLNAEGAMLVTNDKAIPVVAPAVKVKSTVGAGDSMVAGVVFALSTGNDIETATQYGVACGTAATLNAGTELCYKKDVEDLFDEIRSLPKSAANQ